MTNHLRVHGVGVKLKCETCSYETFHRTLMKNHIDYEHLGLGHICDICGERKSRNEYLVQHMKAKHKNDQTN